MADPPWPYSGPGPVGTGGRGKLSREYKQVGLRQHYTTMGIEEIASLPVERYTKEKAHLYLWTTNAFMVQAHSIAQEWGFEVKTIITWCKQQKGKAKPSMKTGYYFRSSTEHCLFATKGNLKLKTRDGVATSFHHKRLSHSVKPDLFSAMVERCSPPPYLELFARRAREGWATWGLEAPGGLNWDELRPHERSRPVMEEYF